MHNYEVTNVRGGCFKFSKIESMLPIGNFHTFIKPIGIRLMNLKESGKGIVGR